MATCLFCSAPDAVFFLCVDGRHYWRCPLCELTFLDPAQRLCADAEAKHYQLHHNDPTDPGYRQFLQPVVEALLPVLMPASVGLDYGCGPGPALAVMLAEAGHRMAVYDPLFAPDRAVLEQQYDFITCTEVIEHFHDPGREFAGLDGLLKPGGWLALMTAFMPPDEQFARWHYRRDPTHVAFYREHTLACWARQRGWCCEFPARHVCLLKKSGDTIAA